MTSMKIVEQLDRKLGVCVVDERAIIEHAWLARFDANHCHNDLPSGIGEQQH